MVGVTYTGIDGQSTSFKSRSANSAIKRLMGIPGYAENDSDRIADSVRAKRKERSKVSQQSHFIGNPSGPKYTSPSGIVSAIPTVNDISVVDGKMVKTSQSRYVSSGGKTVGVGPKRTENLGSVGSASSIVADNSVVGKRGGCEVVIGTEYSPETHQLVNVMGTIVVENGKMSVSESGRKVVTTAVEESVT